MGDGHDSINELIAELTAPVTEGGCAFCGVALQEYAISGVTHQWPRGSKLKWFPAFDDLGGIRTLDARQAMTEALKEITDCCDLEFTQVSSELNANLLIVLQRLDGKMGVLADCEIPVGNVSADRTRLRMRIDTSERWGVSINPVGDLIDFYRVFLHEALHGVGLGHKPASIRDPALIAPMYSPSIRNLQPADKGELLRRYGQAKVVPAPVPSPIGEIKGEIKVTIDGVTYGGAGQLKQLPQSFIYPPLTVPETWDDDDTEILPELP